MTPQKIARRAPRLALGLVFTLLATGLMASLPSSSWGEVPADLSKLDPVKVSAVELKPLMAHPGDTVEVRLKLNIEENYHAYVEQYRLVLESPNNYKLSTFDVSPTVKFVDPNTKKEKIGTEKKAEMVSLVEIPKDASTGTQELAFEMTYQACSKDFCLFPKHVQVTAELQVAGTSEDVFQSALQKGWLYTIFFIFFAGVLTSLTPCIFPMIPITLAIIGSRDPTQSSSRARSFFTSLCYVLGIAVTYSILGVIAAKTGSLFGAYLGSPIVVSIIAAVFVVMALGMYGLFEIQLPLALANRLSSGKAQKGYLGAFGYGLIAGVVASPCVGPVLISVLAYVAQKQSVVTGFSLLFVFALGMGQLFLVIGTFENLWHKLPRSGPWLDQVKFIFGTIMIAMAFYYINPVASRTVFDALLAIALIAIAIGFGAFRAKKENASTFQRAHQMFMRVLFVLGLLFGAVAATPSPVLEKIFGDKESGAQKVAGPEWAHFSDELLKQAAANKKPVILDFKADWCLACKELDLKTFSDAKILTMGKDFVWLEYDATSSTPELEELRKRFEFSGLPFVVIFDKSGSWRKDLTLTGFESADLFINRMQEAAK